VALSTDVSIATAWPGPVGRGVSSATGVVSVGSVVSVVSVVSVDVVVVASSSSEEQPANNRADAIAMTIAVARVWRA
jgi:hypothetical protein